MYRILLVDNHILFREGLSNLLKQEPGIYIVGQAGSIAEAMEQVPKLAPDLTMVDAELPDIEEYDGISLLRALRPEMQVALLSATESADLMFSAIRSGARAFLLKSNSLPSFMAAIHALERGEAVIPRGMTGRLLDAFTRLSYPAEAAATDILTPREIDVLCELAIGRSNQQIALSFAIAENTVKVHVHNILEKLNLRNRRQAAQFARKNGLLNGRNQRMYTRSIGEANQSASPIAPMQAALNH